MHCLRRAANLWLQIVTMPDPSLTDSSASRSVTDVFFAIGLGLSITTTSPGDAEELRIEHALYRFQGMTSFGTQPLRVHEVGVQAQVRILDVAELPPAHPAGLGIPNTPLRAPRRVPSRERLGPPLTHTW